MAGNLSAHLAVLAKAGHVLQESEKHSISRRKTLRITPDGDAAFRAYVKQV